MSALTVLKAGALCGMPRAGLNLETSVGRGRVCGQGGVKAGKLARHAARRLERLQAVLAGRNRA